MPGLWKVDFYLCFQHKELDNRKKMHKPCAFSVGHHLFKMVGEGAEEWDSLSTIPCTCVPIALLLNFSVWNFYHTFENMLHCWITSLSFPGVAVSLQCYFYESRLASAFLLRTALAIQTVVFHIVTPIWLPFCWSNGYLSFFLSGNIYIN